MTFERFQTDAVAALGWSHLLQPPLTLFLATRVLRLREAFAALPPLAGRIAKIMALTAVFMPTALGVLLAWFVRVQGLNTPTRAIALLLAAGLWTPRLVAQLLWIGPCFALHARRWHWVLVAIFFLQGPFLVALLLW